MHGKPHWLFVGLVASVVANIFMGITTAANKMFFIWCANGLVQSMLWPPIVKIMSTYLSRPKGVRAMVNMSSAIPAGTLFTYIFIALARSPAKQRKSTVFPTAYVDNGVDVCSFCHCNARDAARRHHIMDSHFD